jgi:type IV pilus assembly protein PilY1
MTNSFAADVIPVDRDNNGYVDLLYAADVGGRIWRFDFLETATSGSDFATGGIIADINGGTEASNRRFYSAPDVSYQTVGGKSFILLSIGSGYRAHPLNNSVTDYHFLIKDTIGKSYPTSYNAINLTNLIKWGTIDATSSDYGWYVPLEGIGEKALSRSLTFNGQVIFTSYAPNDPDIEVFCGGDTGIARVYSLTMESPEAKETIIELEQGGIPSEPVIPSNPGKIPFTIIGAELVKDVLPANPFAPADNDYWREK